MKDYSVMKLREIKRLDSECINDYEFDELQLNPLVMGSQCLGTSGIDTSKLWYDVLLYDGSRIDLYVM